MPLPLLIALDHIHPHLPQHLRKVPALLHRNIDIARPMQKRGGRISPLHPLLLPLPQHRQRGNPIHKGLILPLRPPLKPLRMHDPLVHPRNRIDPRLRPDIQLGMPPNPLIILDLNPPQRRQLLLGPLLHLGPRHRHRHRILGVPIHHKRSQLLPGKLPLPLRRLDPLPLPLPIQPQLPKEVHQPINIHQRPRHHPPRPPPHLPRHQRRQRPPRRVPDKHVPLRIHRGDPIPLLLGRHDPRQHIPTPRQDMQTILQLVGDRHLRPEAVAVREEVVPALAEAVVQPPGGDVVVAGQKAAAVGVEDKGGGGGGVGGGAFEAPAPDGEGRARVVGGRGEGVVGEGGDGGGGEGALGHFGACWVAEWVAVWRRELGMGKGRGM